MGKSASDHRAALRLAAVVTALLPVMTASPAPEDRSGTATAIETPTDESSRTTLPGHVPPMAGAKFDRGPVPDDFPITELSLVLARSAAKQAQLEQYLAEQQNSNSPSYHRWLTPEQFGARFGATDRDLQTLSEWLQAYGFKVGAVSAGRQQLSFSGTARQVAAAFQVRVHFFSVRGQRHFANVENPSIPSRFKSLVIAISGLNDFVPAPAQP
jgi:hypothetical protein